MFERFGAISTGKEVDMMKRKILSLCAATILLIFFATDHLDAATAESPEQILADSDRARGNGPGLVWRTEIVSVENGREQRRSLEISSKGDNALARFIAPARVKGRMLLMRDRNMWFIKPGLRKPVPISPRQKLIGGTANADIASTNYVKDYRIASMDEENCADQQCYRFDLKARNKKVAYAGIRYWVSKERHLGVQAEFCTRSGKILKSAVFSYQNAITVDGQKRPFVSRMVITDAVIPQNVTTMEYSNVSVEPVADATFNLNLIAH